MIRFPAPEPAIYLADGRKTFLFYFFHLLLSFPRITRASDLLALTTRPRFIVSFRGVRLHCSRQPIILYVHARLNIWRSRSVYHLVGPFSNVHGYITYTILQQCASTYMRDGRRQCQYPSANTAGQYGLRRMRWGIG
jgi:hypothetical protein